MALDLFLQPVFHYALLGLGIAVCLYLTLSVLFESRAAEHRTKVRLEHSEARLLAMQHKLDQMMEDLQELQRHSGMLVPPPPSVSGLNLNKRSQALRLHRRGESSTAIAASLGIPRNEIELLLKVNGIVLQHSVD